MKTPNSTYRLQLHKNFTFRHLEQVTDYLQTLGIDTVYASPIFQAARESTHGYDGVNPNVINPELGTIEALYALKKRLAASGLKWLQDIVPNHMAFDTANPWLADLLQFGIYSAYSSHFDTLYAHSFVPADKLMVPILGKELPDAVHTGDLNIVYEKEQFYLSYFENRFPIRPGSYIHLLKAVVEPSTYQLSQSTERQIKKLDKEGDPKRWDDLRSKIFADILTAAADTELSAMTAQFNSAKERLLEVIEQQHYRLCHWRETDGQINFRRFFTVNGLICMNTHIESVFDDLHHLIGKLVADGIIDGLRIDHIDGLYDPTTYVGKLRKLCGSDTYIVAEKILEEDEHLPDVWPIQGTTGYDFLALCNNLLAFRKSEKAFTEYYERIVNANEPLRQQQVAKKRFVLSQHMRGEIENLCLLFHELQLTEHPLSHGKLRKIIEAFLAYFPVYRIYETAFPLSRHVYTLVTSTLSSIKDDLPACGGEIDIVQEILAKAQRLEDEDFSQRTMRFILRCMQFTGPAMAKGVEDTLMYTYNRFLAHNEVGDHPSRFGLKKKAFHEAMRRRQKEWPLAMNATATHDTKRGEDARCRLHVLTARPKQWFAAVDRWRAVIQHEYTDTLPHSNDVYTILQMLYATYPVHMESGQVYTERFTEYIVKYLREGKERSDWSQPDTDYEESTVRFVKFLLNKNGTFFGDFYDFLRSTADFGIVNSLVQLLLKFTCPGIPDVYQGCELWDFSFVDPDNRRPVDFDIRRRYLNEIRALAPADRLPSLWSDRYSGKIKLWLLHLLATLRKDSPSLFNEGEYIEIDVKGKYRRHVLAYGRQHGDEALLIIVPLHLAAASADGEEDISQLAWADTRVVLPKRIGTKWEHLLQPMSGEDSELMLSVVFKHLPLAVIRLQKKKTSRSAGILMHISSLPSNYGIGDLGKEAYRFAEQLHASGQKWWQLLPLGPLSSEQCYSPYSTWSAMAGNPLFIDLEALSEEGLLTKKDLKTAHSTPSPRVDYEKVEAVKYHLLDKAFGRLDTRDIPRFSQFCETEKSWLHDYALFAVLREKYGEKPWYAWPDNLKKRKKTALAEVEAAHSRDILKHKWMQFVFFQQWERLKDYCHQLDIQIMGDIPIYVGHNSADVWANPDLFSIDKDGSLRAVAGVPPDYFNEDGQLWGMPVFNWDLLKQRGYTWWVQRVRHNCRMFDAARLDHFRAFSAYWEVSATEHTSKNGQWKDGPGADLFNALREDLKTLPFVAEDLGDIDEPVYELRDAYQLPGMKVLQFAFGDDMPVSQNIPHHHDRNFIVYTGTHDNNTVLGWYKNELSSQSKKLISKYVGYHVNAMNINATLIRLAYASPAITAIIPMQDILCLGEQHRMNSPATTAGNWTWRMLPNAFRKKLQKELRLYTYVYDR